MERAYLLAALLALVALPVLWRTLRNLARALRHKFSHGKPYVPGSITRSLVSTLMMLLLLMAAVILGGGRWLARDFQTVSGPTLAGRMQVVEGPPLLLHLESAPAYPQRLVIASGLEDSNWQISGLLLHFPQWTRPLGLGTLHRFTSAGGLHADEQGEPAAVSQLRSLVAALPAFLQVDFARSTLAGQGAGSGWTAVMVSREGYVLGAQE